MRIVVVAALLAACGRVGFDASDSRGDATGSFDDGNGSAGDDTGPAGPRWVKRLGTSSNQMSLSGQSGEVGVVHQFTTSLTGDGVSFTGQGFTSTAFVRYAPDGSIKDTRTFDADGFCDMRAVVYEGDSIIVAGFTRGSTVMPGLGLCSVANDYQEPFAIRISDDGSESVVTHWDASTTNAQLWHATRYGNGQLLYAGVYSGNLTLDTALPTAIADPNAFIARPFAGMPATAHWSHALVSADVVYVGPMSARGSRAFAIGAFAMDDSYFGVPLTSVGGIDLWIARLDEDGTVPFVRSIGSSNNEPDFGEYSSIAALSSGGVAASFLAAGNITFDSQTFAIGQGPGLLVVLDGSGALVAGTQFPAEPRLAAIGDRLFAAVMVNTPYTVGTQTHTPVGDDIVILELDATGRPLQILGVIGGTGDQRPTRFQAIGGDALAIGGISTGALSFGATAFDSGATEVHIIAALGL